MASRLPMLSVFVLLCTSLGGDNSVVDSLFWVVITDEESEGIMLQVSLSEPELPGAPSLGDSSGLESRLPLLVTGG